MMGSWMGEGKGKERKNCGAQLRGRKDVHDGFGKTL